MVNKVVLVGVIYFRVLRLNQRHLYQNSFNAIGFFTLEICFFGMHKVNTNNNDTCNNNATKKKEKKKSIFLDDQSPAASTGDFFYFTLQLRNLCGYTGNDKGILNIPW